MSKEELVRCVQEHAPDDDPVVHQLRALPLATYRSTSEVLASVDVAG